ncbi:MAG TPA: trigger factor [Burkholderiales bacterium]|nr:trigger factor [Burkholderiales bacterium]
MQSKLENLSPLERRLDVTLPLKAIDAEVETRLKKLARTVRLKGFRPGHVPLKIVEQKYAVQVREEVLGETVQKTFGDAVREQNLRIAGFPKIETRKLDQGEFEYSATFEVYPEVVIGELSGVTINRPVVEVGDADIEKTLQILRRQRTRYEEVSRAAMTLDQVALDYRGTISGVEFPGGQAKDQKVVIGSGLLLKAFEENLMNLMAGARKTFELRFPDDYHGKDVAGKTAQFEVTVKSVAAPVIPEVDAEFARSLGVADGDLSKMKEEIRANLEREVEGRIKNKLKEKVMQALASHAQVELPKVLVEGELTRLKEQFKDAVPSDEALAGEASRRVQLGLIVAELVKTQDLGAKPEQVRAIIKRHAQSYERPEEVVRWYYAEPARLKDAEGLALEDNVVTWVLEKAKVVDTPTVFDDLMGNR